MEPRVPFPQREQARRNQTTSIAAQAAQQVFQELQGDIKALVIQFRGQFLEDRTDVSPAVYEQVRRETFHNPKLRQQWVRQVTPEAFFHQLFETYDVPQPVRKAYLDAVKAGLPHAEATAYANTFMPPAVGPDGQLIPPGQPGGPPGAHANPFLTPPPPPPAPMEPPMPMPAPPPPQAPMGPPPPGVV